MYEMNDKKILENVKKLFLNKESNFHSEIGEVHPIYEAVAALIKNQVSDESSRKRLLSSDKESLKSIIVADEFLELLKRDKERNDIKKMFDSGESLDKIVEKASVYLSEGKRSQDGDILYLLGSLSKEMRKNFYKKFSRIKKKFSNAIYLKKDVSVYLENNKERFRKRRLIKYLVIGLVTSGILFGGYWFQRNYDVYVHEKYKNF